MRHRCEQRDRSLLVEAVRADVCIRDPEEPGQSNACLFERQWHLDVAFMKINGDTRYR